MRIYVILPVEEAIEVRRVLRAVRNVAERDNDPNAILTPDGLAHIASAASRIANAITRQTTPRSLVSHED